MRNVILLLLVNLVTCSLGNVCSNNGAGGSYYVCRNASLDNLREIPRHNVYSIKFIKSKIKSIPAYSFAEFNQLKSLSLVNCFIDNMESFAFIGLAQLKSLNLSRNALTKIKGNVFAGLLSLDKLDLTNNMLEIVEDQSFPNVSNIGLIDLRFNNLTRIDVEALRPLSRASTLDVRFNNLRCVALDVFNETKLKWIYLGNNPWDEKCWANLTQCLYNGGIYYGKDQAFDTLTEDRLLWNASYQGDQELLTKEQAEEAANILREAEGWKKFYEAIVQEISDERKRLEDIAIANKATESSGENFTNQTTEGHSESGLLQFGRDLIIGWILSLWQLVPFYSRDDTQ